MSVLCAVTALLVLLAVALYVWQRGRVYYAVFAPAHVREFVGVVQRLRPAALRLGGAIPESLKDERVATTSGGVHVAYTAMPTEDGAVEHHVSVSLLGGYTAAAVGHAFVVIAMEALGFEAGSYAVGRSQRGIWHGAAKLDAEGHASHSERPLPALDEGAIATIFARAQQEASNHKAVKALSIPSR